MKTFKIAVDFRVGGTFQVEAETFEEAIEKTLTNCRTIDVEDQEYIDDSLQVNREMSEDFLEDNND